MTASAHLMQLVRAHYQGNESAFASAAITLARAAKLPTTREGILDLVREGAAAQRRNGNGCGARPSFQPTPPPALATHSMLEQLAPVTFASLLLEPDLQLFLDDLVVELEYRTELQTRGLRARNRFLFHGPPGNGKTSSAAALASALNLSAFAVSLPRTVSKYVSETGENLGRIFDNLTPSTVVVFDEIDAIAAHRGVVDQSAGKEFNSKVNTLLTLMDRKKSGVIIATTNRLDIIDPAVLRRFDEQIFFPAPRPDQLRALADKLADGFDIPRLSERLLEECANYDHVTKVVEREARRIVMKEILAAEAAAETESEQSEQGDEADGDQKEENRKAH